MKETVRTRRSQTAPLGALSLFWLIPAFLLCWSGASLAQSPASPEGLWKTIDDHSGEPRSLVRIYRQGDAYFGRIETVLAPDQADQRCSPCKDERRNQPIIGLVILRNIKAETDGYGGGDILDPESGSVYDCALHLEKDGSHLNVRGYIGLSLFGRSQTWLRED